MDSEYWKSSPFGENSIFHPNFDKKDLKIRYLRCEKDDTFTYLHFEITARNLSSEKATLIVVESEVFRDEKIISQFITISRNGTKYFQVKFSEKKLSKTIFEGDFEFKATIICDGLSATTGEFKIKCSTKKKEEKKDEITAFPNFQVCPIDKDHRSHFVIHCTAGNMSIAAIKKLTHFDEPENKARSKAHAYIQKDGTILQIWPFSERIVWATKAESAKNLKGQMFHVELNYDSNEHPTDAQYKSLVTLYIEASSIEGCWPIIVPHIEIDRGIPNGHSDPTNFDYNYFYQLLKQEGVPIDSIPKFEHERYWGNATYKVPWASDKYSWPPVLSGNPHSHD